MIQESRGRNAYKVKKLIQRDGRGTKKKRICDIISGNTILQHVVSKNKYWNFSRLSVKLQKKREKKTRKNPISTSGVNS